VVHGGERDPAPAVADRRNGARDRRDRRSVPGGSDAAPAPAGIGAEELTAERITRLARSADPYQALRAVGLRPDPWSAGPGATFTRHSHESTKHLFVLDGSIDFDGLPLEVGEGIVIQAGTPHAAVVGESGVTCIEAFEGN
jgi:hypothetical protein